MITFTELPIQSFTFLNTLGTTTDANGNIITFPFTATSSGVYVIDMTLVTTVGNTGSFSDTTTLLTINGSLQFSNLNYSARSYPNQPAASCVIELIHNHRAKVTLNNGDVVYFGATSSVNPPEISNGSMLIYKIA
jgi:hypothetical protein